MISSSGIFAFTFSLDSSRVPDNSYIITDYSAEYEYVDGRTFAVTEKVTAVFNESGKHGIIRDLAVNSGEVYYEVSASGAPYNVKSESLSFISVYLGDEDRVVPVGQPQQYTINYKFKIPERENRDEFAINVLGGEDRKLYLQAYPPLLSERNKSCGRRRDKQRRRQDLHGYRFRTERI